MFFISGTASQHVYNLCVLMKSLTLYLPVQISSVTQRKAHFRQSDLSCQAGLMASRMQAHPQYTICEHHADGDVLSILELQ